MSNLTTYKVEYEATTAIYFRKDQTVVTGCGYAQVDWTAQLVINDLFIIDIDARGSEYIEIKSSTEMTWKTSEDQDAAFYKNIKCKFTDKIAEDLLHQGFIWKEEYVKIFVITTAFDLISSFT